MKNMYKLADSVDSKFCYFAGERADQLSRDIESRLDEEEKMAIQKNLISRYGEEFYEDTAFQEAIKDKPKLNGYLGKVKNSENGFNRAIDGIFGSSTRLLIAYHQFKQDIGIDGRWGPESAEAYNGLEQEEKAVVVTTIKAQLEETEKSVCDPAEALKKDLEAHHHETILPDWFVKAENDAVRVATLRRYAKGFENITRNSVQGGNIETFVQALKSLHSDKFENTLVGSFRKKEKMKVSVESLAGVLPGLTGEQYKNLLKLLDGTNGIENSLSEEKISRLEEDAGFSIGEGEYAALQNRTVEIETNSWFGGDLPLEAEVLADDSYQVLVYGEKGVGKQKFEKSEIEKLVDGDILEKGNKIYAQAQGTVFEVKKESKEIKTLSTIVDGKSINLDREIFEKLELTEDFQKYDTENVGFTDEITASGERVLSTAIHYLVNMLDAKELNRYLKVNEDGQMYLTGDKVQNILQSLINKANELNPGMTDQDDDEESTNLEKDFDAELPSVQAKIDALVHDIAENKLEIKDKSKISWRIDKITNTNFDRSISGASRKEVEKLLMLKLKERNKELTRDEYLTQGAESDFAIFELQMNTALQNLVADGVITNDLEKYKKFEDEVIAMGENDYNRFEKNKSFLAELKESRKSEAQIRNMKFMFGSLALLGKSKIDATTLQTEYKRLYTGEKGQTIHEIFEKNKKQKAILEGLGLTEDCLALLGQEDPQIQALLKDSGLKLGGQIVTVEDVTVPETTRELVGMVRTRTYTKGEQQINTITTGNGTVITPQKEVMWEEECGGQLCTFTKNTYKVTTTTGTKEITTTTQGYTDTTTKKYKVTEYYIEDVETGMKISIDLNANVLNMGLPAGFEIGADVGIGAIFGEKDSQYISFGFNAQNQVTTNLLVNEGANISLSPNRLAGVMNIGAESRLTKNLLVFGNINSGSVDAFSKLFRLDRATTTFGVSLNLGTQDLTVTSTEGVGIKGVSVVLRKNEKYFTEKLKEAIESISNKDADARTKTILGEDLSDAELQRYRKWSKTTIACAEFSSQIVGRPTSIGLSVLNVGNAEIFSLLLGFAIDAKIVNNITPHENKRDETIRNYLQKSGDFAKNLRHVREISLDKLRGKDNTYNLLPKNYIADRLSQKKATENKKVTVNVYIAPQYKDKIKINNDGTFTINSSDGSDNKHLTPFVLDKITDGSEEINIYFGPRAEALGTKKAWTTGEMSTIDDFKFEGIENQAEDSEWSEKFNKMRAKRIEALNGIEDSIFKALNKGKNDTYNKVLKLEELFRQKENSTKTLEELVEVADDARLKEYLNSLNNYLKKVEPPFSNGELANAIIKARMKYSNQDFVKEIEKNSEKLKEKKDLAIRHKNVWANSLKAFRINDQELLDPSKALADPEKGKDISVSGGFGAIVGPKGTMVGQTEMNNTLIRNAKEYDITDKKGNQYRVITGYLDECRNPMFVIQSVPKGGIVSDQENTRVTKGIEVTELTLAIGIEKITPGIGSTVHYETGTSSTSGSNSSTSTGYSETTDIKYRTEITKTCKPIEKDDFNSTDQKNDPNLSTAPVF